MAALTDIINIISTSISSRSKYLLRPGESIDWSCCWVGLPS